MIFPHTGHIKKRERIIFAETLEFVTVLQYPYDCSRYILIHSFHSSYNKCIASRNDGYALILSIRFIDDLRHPDKSFPSHLHGYNLIGYSVV